MDNRGFDFHDGNLDVIGSPRWSNITLSNGVMVHILVMHEFLSIMMLIENGSKLANYCQKS